ncbi:MAG: UPF0104 family protein [Cyanobacteriota bacterium]|nr:UPF0104 family protein [Cyanobacteriota bacterium]
MKGPLLFRQPALPALPALPGKLRLWVTLLSLGFLLSALLNNSAELLQQRLDLQGWLWLSLGVGLSLLSLLLSATSWRVLLQQLGMMPGSNPVMVAYIETNQRRHLPGGLAHLATRLSFLRGMNPSAMVSANAGPSLLAVLLEPLLACFACLALVGIGGWQRGIGAVCLAPLLLLQPRWLQGLLAWLQQTLAPDLGVDPAELDPPAPTLRTTLLSGLVGELAVVMIRFGAFGCCLMAFDLGASLDWNAWLAGFALAWAAALVIPGAPAGLGVFEAVLLIRLGAVVPAAALLVVALSHRGVLSLADGLAAVTTAPRT